STADDVDQSVDVLCRMGESGDRQSDSVAGQQLLAAEFVTRSGDRLGFVGREDAHHLELPYDGSSVERVGGSDPGDYGVIVVEFPPRIDDRRAMRSDVHVASQVVDHVYAMTPFLPRFPKPARRVQRLLAGENG